MRIPVYVAGSANKRRILTESVVIASAKNRGCRCYNERRPDRRLTAMGRRVKQKAERAMQT